MSKMIERLALEVESIRSEIEQEAEEESWGPNESLRQDAMERRIKSYEELKKRGELITARELAELRQVGQSTISEALKRRRIFRVSVGGRDFYPRFFADHEANRKDIEAISKELGSLPGSVKLGFFNKRLVSLGGLTPLEALAKGKLDEVKRAAMAKREL